MKPVNALIPDCSYITKELVVLMQMQLVIIHSNHMASNALDNLTHSENAILDGGIHVQFELFVPLCDRNILCVIE